MAGFTPFKRHAKEFKYTPRYYDPVSEEFERRRMELRGERRDTRNDGGEYTPGQYIRAKRMTREQMRRDSMRGARRRVWISVAVVVMIFFVGTIILPRIIDAFSPSEDRERGRATQEWEEFNPYAPIRVVPNDYKE